MDRDQTAAAPLLAPEDFALIFESSPTPYMILRADAPRFTIASTNKAYQDATKTDPSMIGRGLFEVFPDNPGDNSATGVSDLRASLERVLRDGRTDDMGVQKYDIPLHDGKGGFEVKYWTPVNIPLKRPDGSFSLILHRAEDVTEFILAHEQPPTHQTASSDRRGADVLRGGAQIKQTNRELKHGLEQLTRSDYLKGEQLDVAIQAARLGLWTLDFRTNDFITSDICRRDYGWLSDEPFTIQALLEMIHPDDRARRNEQVAEALAAHKDLDLEYRITRPDGEVVWIAVRGRGEYDEAGKAIRAMGVSADVTPRKRAEERQRVMIAELNHRVKNTLASVQSIALQTSMAAPNPKDFVVAFDGRVRALVLAHDLLTANSWQGASLSEVVERTLAPHAAGAAGASRIEVSGPLMQVAPETAVTLHMAFHELATNASKYGALSTPTGRVTVAWTIDRTTDPANLEITWTESHGPAVTPPTRQGFGSNLLEKGLAREFGGAVKLTYAPEGVTCHMRFAASGRFQVR